MKSYINVYQCDANHLHHIYIENGKRKSEKVRYQPFLGTHTTKESKWKDIYGKNVKMTRFDSISDMRSWKKENSEGFEILCDIAPVYQFIAEEYQEKIEIQRDDLFIGNLDIEVYSPSGEFPTPEVAAGEVNLITIQDMFKNIYYSFGCFDVVTSQDNCKYFKCKNESDLLQTFITFMNDNHVDILTGWNIDRFDMPYLVNRTTIVCGVEWMNKLSPDRKVNRHEKTLTDGKKEITYSFQGRICWDYIELYKKYTFDPRESYSLNYISKFELGEEKIKFKDEYDNLNKLYLENFQLFYEYNLKDVELVYNIDKKIAYIPLALTLMYNMKCHGSDIFGTVKPWDAYIFSELMKKNIAIPAVKQNFKQEFPGGFCKDPHKGLQKWISVFDIVSSYPNQIRSSNISPETIVNDHELPPEVLDLRRRYGTIEACIDVENIDPALTEALVKHNLSYCANGSFYRRDVQGILPKVVGEMFNDRVAIKKKMKTVKKNSDEYAALDASNLSYKVALNSLYGAMSNIYFRFFDIRMASAVTSNGQVCSRGVPIYVEKRLPVTNMYIDTDSNFFSLEEVVNKRYPKGIPDKKTVCDFILKFQDQVLYPTINEFFVLLSKTFNSFDSTIQMEHECISDVAIFKEKKKYVLKQLFKEGDWYIDKTKLKIKGIEIVQTSSPQFSRDALKHAIEILFETEDNSKIIDYIEETRVKFYTLPFEEISYTKSATFANYTLQSSSLPINVRAALKYNEALRTFKIEKKYENLRDGNKIKYTFIKEPNRFKSNVIACPDKMPKEILAHLEIDYKVAFEKTFLSPLRKILELAGMHTEKTNSLEDFFS